MDDNTKKDLQQLIDQGFKNIRESLEEDMIRIFNQGFEEVVLPNIERLDDSMATVKTGLEKVEARLERVENRLDFLVDQVGDHDIRIKKLERKPVGAVAA